MKLIILDRDGVINHDSDAFIKSPEEFIPIDGSLEAIARLKKAGYTVVVATNQSGIARKLLSLETLAQIHHKLTALLADLDAGIDAIYFCPHGPDDLCDCRKPKPGLLQQAARDFGTSLQGIPVVGDSLRDLQAAQAVGASPVLVRSGKGNRTLAAAAGQISVPVYENLAEFVTHLLAN